ncbi:hypothetical protein [Hallella mizrahii]|uniref:Lipoprotein n=1 Tax=Hallella mizrahii TaxID=2606637 RepID=A0A7K0KEV2_9BACT|nr:hypothetical protein [Hallella mizrahii]MST83950.1 hypothetical protein [Hallella mizrahii]
MKKNFLFLGMGAMALATPLFLSSCSSSDDAPNDTPVPYTGETVKTSFTLSVGLPKGNSTNGAKSNFGTRMSEDITQAQGTPVFRGIDNISLIPFAIKGNNVSSTDTREGDQNITLPNTTPNSLTNLTNTGNAHVYNDVSVPVGTNAFLFYGKAVDANAGTNASTTDDMFKYGTLTADGLSEATLSAVSFTPVAIAAKPSTTKGEAIATYLTSIANAKASGDNGKAWSDVKEDGTSGQGKALATLYKNFTSMTAGSSKNIQLAVQDLYTSLVGLKDQTTDNQGIIDAIKTAITNATYASASTGDKLTFTDAISGYPEDNNLPDGAATVTWDNANKKFSANTAKSVLDDGTSIAAMNSYVYPANLWYFVNTKINTDDAERNGDYVDNNSWETILGKYANKDATVQTSTRSIALKNQIQYAVGRLDTKVTLASTLYDHTGATVTPNNAGFPIKSVLVGGQKAVDWEFVPVSANDAPQYTIYDKDVPTGMAAISNGSTVNHTLVLETAENQAVYMVVELENNTGKDFAGHNGDIIKNGANFYMVAKLDPKSTTDGEVKQPETSTSLTKVFQQDYVTTANLTILENGSDVANHDKGLGAAYNVIPDLRTPALSIGLSVDLNWQTGLTFNIGM